MTAMEEQAKSKSGMAIAGLVLGIVALVGSWIPILNNLSAILAVLGLVFGIVGMVGISRGKKSGKGLAIAAIIVCVVSFAVVMGTQSMYSAAIDEATNPTVSTDGEVAADSSASSSASTSEAKYDISGEAMDASDGYTVKIVGTFTNNSDAELSYAEVDYILLDADGNQVGTALANTNNLKAGGSWKFEAYGTASPDEVASFERADVSAW